MKHVKKPWGNGMGVEREISIRRFAAGVTQGTLAERAHISRQSLNGYERGRKRLLGRTVERIEVALAEMIQDQDADRAAIV